MTESMIERVAKAIQGELPEFTGVTPEYLQALYKNAGLQDQQTGLACLWRRINPLPA